MKKEFLQTDGCDFALCNILSYIAHFFKYIINRCIFVLASEEFIDERIGMLINKDSPYLPVINQE